MGVSSGVIWVVVSISIPNLSAANCSGIIPRMNKENKHRLGMGIVGAGFVGPHHIDAVRRLGFVDIVAVAGSNEASGQRKAEQIGARKGYGDYQALIDTRGLDDLRRRESRDALKRLLVAGFGTMQAMMYASAIYLGAADSLDETTRGMLRWNVRETSPFR